MSSPAGTTSSSRDGNRRSAAASAAWAPAEPSQPKTALGAPAVAAARRALDRARACGYGALAVRAEAVRAAAYSSRTGAGPGATR
jgi:hypothetical protein